jgi:hypothetical protein
MPYKDPERAKENKREYYIKNKEKLAEYKKEYRRTHTRVYTQKDQEYQKWYSQTDAGKKTRRIHDWKRSEPPVKCDDFNALYEYYINTTHCENCNVELVEGSKAANRKCLDHCHETGEFRNILCNTCNVRRK